MINDGAHVQMALDLYNEEEPFREFVDVVVGSLVSQGGVKKGTPLAAILTARIAGQDTCLAKVLIYNWEGIQDHSQGFRSWAREKGIEI